MTTDWNELRRHVRSNERPPEWPDGIYSISVEGGALIGIDASNNLDWDGKPIEIQKRLKFSRLQVVGALVVGIATLIGGVGTGVNEGFDFGCKVHWWTKGCSR